MFVTLLYGLKKKILENTEKQRQDFLHKTKMHTEEAKILRNLIEKGNIHKEKLVESEKHLKATTSPQAVMDKIEVVIQMRLMLSNHCMLRW